MVRDTEHGVIRLKTIIWAVIFGVLIYTAITVFPAYFADSQLKDKMYEEARFAQVNNRTEEQLRDIIYREALSDGIALRREDIKVELTPGATVISADYTVPVDLHFYQFKLYFHPSSAR